MTKPESTPCFKIIADKASCHLGLKSSRKVASLGLLTEASESNVPSGVICANASCMSLTFSLFNNK